MTLKIKRITTRVVAVPLDEPIVNPFVGARTQFATLLVEVHASDGTRGFGYASIESVRMVRAVECIIQDLENLIKGMDPLRRAQVYETMWRATVDLLHDGAVNLALTAIDVALWDLCGKLAEQPLWKLLGGFRQKQPVYASWTLWRHQSADRWQEDAAMLVKRGHRAMKLRIGVTRPFDEDAQRAKLVRDVVGPDVDLMVDALWGLTVNQGIRMARMLGELNYAWLEEPVREGDFAGLEQVRACQALPIAAGERISRIGHLKNLVPAVNHVILDAHHLGGITPWLKAANELESLNIPISAHSHPFTHMHLLASNRCGAWVEYMPWWDALFVDPPQPVNGAFELTDAPGLGLVLDEKAIRKFQIK
jgi:L-alanine-DL-glutamate epimerase-like enolase superfamily enzyme